MTSRSQAIRPWEVYLWPALTCLVILLLWQVLVLWSRTAVFPSPLAVVGGIAELIHRHVLGRYIVDSLRHVLMGFSFAVLFAVPSGLVLGWYTEAANTVNPIIQILRPISPIAWIPFSIVIFGIGDRSAIFLIFLAAFFPILVSTIGAVAGVPAVFRRTGSNFGLSPLRLLGAVILPAALPDILNGLRIAFGIAWIVLVAAEMVAVDSGLGFLVIDARNSGKRYDLVIASMLLIGLLGLVLDLCFRALERIPALRWRVRHGA